MENSHRLVEAALRGRPTLVYNLTYRAPSIKEGRPRSAAPTNGTQYAKGIFEDGKDHSVSALVARNRYRGLFDLPSVVHL